MNTNKGMTGMNPTSVTINSGQVTPSIAIPSNPVNVPLLLFWGGLTIAALALPGAGKIVAIAPAFMAYNFGLQGHTLAIG